MQVRDLPLLLRVRGLLQRQLLRAHHFELRVVAGVSGELAPVHVDDLVDDAVQEIAVVCDQQQRSRIFSEPVLEPQHRVEVEMVGRLVEQQKIGAAHQRLREIQAHAPSAGETRHRVRVPILGKTQARQQRGRARPRAVTADVVEAMVQVRQRFAVERVIAFRGGQCRFDLAQLAVAVEHVVDRGHRDGRRLLRHVRDRPRRRQRNGTGIGQQFLPDGGEEAGLAAAVRADQAHLVAGVDGQVGAFEQAFGAARQREIGDAQHGLAELVVVIDDQRRVVRKPPVPVDRRACALWPRRPAWRSGSRYASRRCWPRLGRDSTTTCTAPAAGRSCGTRRRILARRIRASATRVPRAGSRNSSGCCASS